jgi:leucyl-tRNA synthetase
MNTYVQETRNGFEGVLNWLNKWACARSFGLGSRLPWDPQWLVESLSDSTIYMAYYTVAHHLHRKSPPFTTRRKYSPSDIEDIKGEKQGHMGIKPSEMTDEVWDYIFRDGPFPADTTIPKKHLDHLKSDFNYFYPFDIRSSGKDLIPNHLTFCVYNHAALFPEDKWPVSMRTNGHLMLNGKKMSKSTGNSLTMKDSVEKFGADVTRVVLADAGDGIEDANFEEKNANANVLRIHTLVQWSEVGILLSVRVAMGTG